MLFTHLPDFDGDEEPMTLAEWRERQRIEFVLMRARVHAELDALLDQQAARMELDYYRVERDMHGPTQH